MTFKFIELDKQVLPKTKGKRIDGFRFYNIDGKNYPSVTTVLGIRKKEGLQKWRDAIGENVANWEMGRAARRGKAFHTLVEQYIKGETPSIRDVLPIGLFKLMKPYIDQIDNIHLLEAIMYSPKLTIAGQVDCVAEYNGKLSVIDFKTANKERQERISIIILMRIILRTYRDFVITFYNQSETISVKLYQYQVGFVVQNCV